MVFFFHFLQRFTHTAIFMRLWAEALFNKLHGYYSPRLSVAKTAEGKKIWLPVWTTALSPPTRPYSGLYPARRHIISDLPDLKYLLLDSHNRMLRTFQHWIISLRSAALLTRAGCLGSTRSAAPLKLESVMNSDAFNVSESQKSITICRWYPTLLCRTQNPVFYRVF